MDRKKKIIFFIIIALIVLLGLYYWANTSTTPNENNPVFINTIGDWSITSGNTTPINLFFFDDKNSSIFDNKNMILSFDNENIKVIDYTVNKGDAYKDMRLYSILLNVKSEKTGAQTISKIMSVNSGGVILEKTFGEITIDFNESSSNKGIKIIENTGSSEEFDRYEFKFQNSESTPLIVDEISYGSFIQYIEKVDLEINGQSSATDTNIKLNPGDELKAVIKFSNTAKYDIMTFAPVLKYHFENSPSVQEYNFPFAIYGLPIKENSLASYYKVYNEKY